MRRSSTISITAPSTATASAVSDDAAPEAERRRRACVAMRIGDVGAQHVQRPMRDIDDAGDAEDQRQPGRDEEQARRAREPVEGLEEEGRASWRASLPCGEGAARASREADEGRDPGPLPAARLSLAPSPASGEGKRVQACVTHSPRGRSFFTSSSDGRTAAPSTYLKSPSCPCRP